MERQNLHRGPRCNNCKMQFICFPFGMNQEEANLVTDILLDTSIVVKKKEFVYKLQTPFQKIFYLRSGCIKLVDDKNNIIDFIFPGEFFGFDGIEKNVYVLSAIATDDSCLCVICYNKLIFASQRVKGLLKFIFSNMGARINNLLLHNLLRHKNKKQRFCSFLKKISETNKLNGYSAYEFNLLMSKIDIANYLDMANETLSRIISSLMQEGCLLVENKHVKILKPEVIFND